MPSDRSIRISGEEHLKIKYTLLDLVASFQDRNKTQIQSLLNQAAVYARHTLRYEQEALYPALIEIF